MPTSPIKSPEDMRNEFERNVETGAQEIVREVLTDYGRAGKRVVVSNYTKPTESLAIAAERLNDAGWAVEYGRLASDSSVVTPAIAITTRQDYVERLVRSFRRRSVYAMTCALVLWMLVMPVAVAHSTSLVMVALAAAATVAVVYTTARVLGRKQLELKQRAIFSDKQWTAQAVRRVQPN